MRGNTYRDDPYDCLLRCPSVPEQSTREESNGQPGIFAHPVFGSGHERAFFVVAAGIAGFAGHDVVGPFPAKDGSNDQTEGEGEIQQTDDEGGVVVGRGRKGLLNADAPDSDDAEGDAGEIDGDQDCGESEIGENSKWVEGCFRDCCSLLSDATFRSDLVRSFQCGWR